MLGCNFFVAQRIGKLHCTKSLLLIEERFVKPARLNHLDLYVCRPETIYAAVNKKPSTPSYTIGEGKHAITMSVMKL